MTSLSVLSLALLLVVPGAVAAPFALHLDHAARVKTEGVTSVATNSGVLNATAAVLADPTLRARFGSISGDVVTTTHVRAVGSFDLGEPQRDPVTAGRGSIERIDCGATACLVAWIISGPTGDARLLFPDGATIEQLTTPYQYCGYQCNNGADPSRLMDAGAFRVERAAGARGPTAAVTGDVVLLVRDARVTLREDGAGGRTIDATETPAASPGTSSFRYAALRVSAANVTLTSGPATLDADELRVGFAKALASPDASGRARLAREETTFANAPVRVDGSGTLDAAPLAISTLLAPQATGSDLRGDAAGEATRIQAGTVVLDTPPALPRAVLVATALGGALLLLALAPRVLMFLYTRVERGEVLDNPNRARIHALIGERPGATAADVSRELGLARAVSQHHLRMLEAHALTLTRRTGIETRYYHPAAAPPLDVARRDRALRDDTRLRVARAIVGRAGEGATQADLVRTTGLSQRLVSYHVGRLADVGLVRVEGRNPQRYHGSDALVSALHGAVIESVSIVDA